MVATAWKDNDKNLASRSGRTCRRGKPIDGTCGPLHDPDNGRIDHRYAQGWWETLSIGKTAITMVGCSPEPMTDSWDVQGGLFLTSRGSRGSTCMIVGGGA